MKKMLIFIVFFSLFQQSNAQDYWMYKKLVDTTLVSTNLGFEKGITITVPRMWRQDLQQEYPVILVFDRYNEMTHQSIVRAVDHLTSSQQMPDAIVVSIDSGQQRYYETVHQVTNEKSLLKANERFIFDELLPWIEKDFHASKFRVFVGHSRYGYFTTSLLFSHLNDLTAVISLDPFFRQKNVDLTDSIIRLNDSKPNNTKYYRFANGYEYTDDYFAMEKAVKSVKNEKMDIQSMYFSEGNHYSLPSIAIAQQLYEIFAFWATRQDQFLKDTTLALKDYSLMEDEMKSHYGFLLNCSYAIMNGKASKFYYAKKYQEAILVWQFILKQFPNFSGIYLDIADAQKQLGVSCKETIEEYKQRIAQSTLYTQEERQELEQWLKELLE